MFRGFNEVEATEGATEVLLEVEAEGEAADSASNYCDSHDWICGCVLGEKGMDSAPCYRH